MVKLLNFGDTKLPVRVSYYALKMLKEKTNKSLDGKVDLTFDEMEILLFHSLEQGHRVTNTPFTFKQEDMTQVMDVVWMDFMKVIPEFFSKKSGGPGK